jgi:hypothetical protein
LVIPKQKVGGRKSVEKVRDGCLYTFRRASSKRRSLDADLKS